MEKTFCVLMVIASMIGMIAAEGLSFWWFINAFNLFMWAGWTYEVFDRD